MDERTEESRPLLRVVRGNPDPAELAALTAVVATATANAGEAEEETSSAWRTRTGLMRRQLDPGPGAWRASGLPH